MSRFGRQRRRERDRRRKARARGASVTRATLCNAVQHRETFQRSKGASLS